MNGSKMSLEVLPPPSKDTLHRIWTEYGLNEHSIKEAVQKIKDWLELQPHLPNDFDDVRIERWIIRCKNSLEKAKQSLDMYYTMKTLTPEIMTKWDANSEWFKNFTSTMYFVPVPRLTPDSSRIVQAGYLTTDATHFNAEDYFKTVLMVMEVRMFEDYCKSDTYILDMANYTLAHVPKITYPVLKKAEVCVMKGYSTRIKQIHMINAPPYGEFFINLVKSVMKSKIAARIYVHGTDLTEFYKLVPQKYLLSEYGGEAGTINENWDLWKKKLQSYQKWFNQRDVLKSDESKRPGGNFNTSDLFGFEGSFRKLQVD